MHNLQHLKNNIIGYEALTTH